MIPRLFVRVIDEGLTAMLKVVNPADSAAVK